MGLIVRLINDNTHPPSHRHFSGKYRAEVSRIIEGTEGRRDELLMKLVVSDKKFLEMIYREEFGNNADPITTFRDRYVASKEPLRVGREQIGEAAADGNNASPRVVVDRLFSLFDASEYGATISRYDFVSTIELFLKGSLSAQLRCAFHVYRLSASRKDIRGKTVEVVTRGDLFRLMRLDACASPWMKGDVLNLLRVFHSRADACLEDGLRLGDSVEALVNAQTLYPRINHHNSLLLDYEGGSWQYDSTQKLIDDLIHRITEAEDSGSSSSEQSVDSHSMRDYVTFDEFRASARSCSMTKLFVHLISSANLSKSRRRRREACK
ncbi:hypothetical protein FOZ60_003120 [Perkinsus olseni]|uniref:Uncharacterized protein n=1 Tax=Perkinsus olseni TaxID=32597 RepID=A0A7J6NYP8_PEROL|nr:hypothetical protein FOZ60_003120 [Perkinsus olseni]